MLLYTVRCSLSIFEGQTIFFDKKILCVHKRDRYLDANPAYSVRQKTCSRNMANTFYTLLAVRRFFVVSPLFRCCLRIVYNGLMGHSFGFASVLYTSFSFVYRCGPGLTTWNETASTIPQHHSIYHQFLKLKCCLRSQCFKFNAAVKAWVNTYATKLDWGFYYKGICKLGAFYEKLLNQFGT